MSAKVLPVVAFSVLELKEYVSMLRFYMGDGCQMLVILIASQAFATELSLQRLDIVFLGLLSILLANKYKFVKGSSSILFNFSLVSFGCRNICDKCHTIPIFIIQIF